MYRNKSIEELLDLEAVLHGERDAAEGKGYYPYVSLYEALCKKMEQDKTGDYADSLETVKEKLIFYLVEYGTYLKTDYQKDDHSARHSFEKAIRYERSLPIAHYRLGFLHYKSRQYFLALLRFRNALQYQQKDLFPEYRLNKVQLRHCHMYLANCGLFVAKDAQEGLEKIADGEEENPTLSYEISPYYELIQHNNQVLHSEAYLLVTKEANTYAALEACRDASESCDMLILDLTDRGSHVVRFNEKYKNLSKEQMELLRLLFLKSKKNDAVTRYDVFDLTRNKEEREAVLSNTFTQAIARLRRKLRGLEAGLPFIETTEKYGETAYAYNPSLPFLIIHRSDESFLLE